MEGKLVLFDCDRIHQYVFATGRLKEIRGASAIINELTTPKKAGTDGCKPSDVEILKDTSIADNNAELVCAGGGVIKLILSDGKTDPEELIKNVEAKFLKETVTSSITGCCVPLEEEGSFQEALIKGEKELRARKDGKRFALHALGGGYMRICQSCAMLPAVYSETQDGKMDGRWLCPSCVKKRKKADSLSRDFRGYWDMWGLPEPEAFAEAKDGWKNADLAEELGEMGELSSPRGYIGFVYCDANRMSERFKSCASKEDYRSLSSLVDETSRECLAEALRCLYPEPRSLDGKRLVPFDIVLYGGDDLILICTAEMAVEFASLYCRRFQEETHKKAKDIWNDRNPLANGISVSAGVVIAHAKHPILGLYRQAERLLKSAKRRSLSAYLEGNELGALDFQAVSTPSLRDLERVRNEEYARIDGTGNRRLTARPYLCIPDGVTGPPDHRDIRLLIEGIRKIKQAGFPATKLHSIYHSLLTRSKMQATLELLWIRSRLPQDARSAFDEYIKDSQLNSAYPWRKCSDPQASEQNLSEETTLVDMVELYDFVSSKDSRSRCREKNGGGGED